MKSLVVFVLLHVSQNTFLEFEISFCSAIILICFAFKTKFMENIKGSVYYPHFYADGIVKEIIAICKVSGFFHFK